MDRLPNTLRNPANRAAPAPQPNDYDSFAEAYSAENESSPQPVNKGRPVNKGKA